MPGPLVLSETRNDVYKKTILSFYVLLYLPTDLKIIRYDFTGMVQLKCTLATSTTIKVTAKLKTQIKKCTKHIVFVFIGIYHPVSFILPH